MKERLILVLILLFFLVFATSYALKTDPNAPVKKEVIDAVPVWEGNNLPVADGSEIPPNLRFPYLLMPADTCVPAPPTSSPNLTPINWDEVGWTRYALQKNGSPNRMIAVDAEGANYNRSFVYTLLPSGIYPGAARYVGYNRKRTDNTWLFAWNGDQRMTEEGVNAGFTVVDILKSSGRAVAVYHTTAGTPLAYSRATIFSFRTGSGGNVWYDIPDSIAGRPFIGQWPKVATDIADTIHFLLVEGNTAGGAVQALGYTRCYLQPGTPGAQTMICQSPGGLGPYTIAPNSFAPLSNQCATLDSITTISGVIATSPISGKVAMVYSKFRAYPSPGQLNNDIYYVESTNYGRSWLTSGFGVPINVSQYATSDMERSYADIAAAYDFNDNLHIIWNAGWYDEVAGTYSPRRANLRHWTYAGGNPPGIANTQIVYSAQWDGTVPGSWNRNISKMSLSVKSTNDAYGFINYLYTTWSEFDTGDLSAAGYTNSEIYASASSDGGKTWDGPYPLTNTKSKDCQAGNCCSEHWSSMAKYVDSTLHIQYILDRDPGTEIQNEGSWTYNPVQYLRIRTWKPVTTRRLACDPTTVGTPTPLKITGTYIDTLKLTSTGNDTVKVDSITVSIQVPPGGSATPSIAPTTPYTILPGKSQDVTFTLANPTIDESYFVRIKIYYNPTPPSTSPIEVKMHFIYSDAYITPKWTVLGDSLRLAVGNVGNIAHEVDTAGLYLVRDSANFLYDASPFVASIATYDSKVDTAIARWMFNDYYFAAEDSLDTGSSNVVSGDTIIKTTWAKAVFFPDVPKLKRVSDYCHIFWPITLEKTTWKLVFYVLGKFEFAKVIQRIVIRFDNPPPPYWCNPAPAADNWGDIYIGEVGDFDVPSDSGSRNYGGVNDSLNMVYQQGYTAPSGGPLESYFGALVYLSNTPYYSAYAARNDTTVYPHSGYWDPQLYKILSTPGSAVMAPTDPTDRNVIMTAKKYSPTSPVDTLYFAWVVTTKGYMDLKKVVCDAFNEWGVSPPGGPDACILCMCGDANLDAVVDIGDIVYLINYVFYGGTAPQPNDACNDVNFDTVIDIGDIVYLINYVFYGGTEPNCGF
jgi:hypothetical protein